MDRTPGYAVVNESVRLAKAMANPRFPSFLNALLRKLSDKIPELPGGDDTASLALRYSYPDFFVEELVKDYGLEQAKQVLSAGNSPPVVMARRRPTFQMEVVKGGEGLARYAGSSEYYIQNAAPVHLMEKLSEGLASPQAILDLCAAPGGKLVAAHDRFPEAALYANEISPERMPRLLENIKKYGLQAEVSLGAGEDFRSERKFDLVILDVPCSNTGVLNKRPEARWRVTPEALQGLERTQLALIENAAKLLAPKGCLFYLTCSILKSENAGLAQKACDRLGLRCESPVALLPDREGRDGGFGCRLAVRKLG
jgi:16S rRNA (cytosine967-C5)-methyltransferase